MPAGCPSCSSEGAPSNVAPVYARMVGVKPGKLSGRGLARYAAQMPVPRDRLVTLGEGDTPLIASHALGAEMGLRRLFLKDERANPTGSWRDRFAALAVSQIEDRETTIGTVGDDALAISFAAYAARAGLRSVGLVDSDIDPRARDAMDAVGGRVVAVRSPDERWPLLADAERSLGWRTFSNRTSPPIGGDPLSIEAYRTIAFEMVEQLRFAAPDLVIVPAGLGDGIQGIWRGPPRARRVGRYRPDSADGCGGGRRGGCKRACRRQGLGGAAPPRRLAPRRSSGLTGTVQTLQAVVESEGLVVRVSEPELDQARIMLGEFEGIWSDLAAAAPIAATIKLAQRGDVPARTLIAAVVTGHGMQDGGSGAPGEVEVVDARVDDLLRVLAVRGE